MTGPHANKIRASLANGVVFETLEDALDAQSRHPAIPCVTLQGETIRGAMVEWRAIRTTATPRASSGWRSLAPASATTR